MNKPLALIVGGSSLLGVIITSLFNIWNTRINKRYELRKSRQELAAQAAIESWKKLIDVAVETSKATGRHIDVMPIEAFILRMVKIAELADDKNVTAENIRQKLEEIDKTSDVIEKYVLETKAE